MHEVEQNYTHTHKKTPTKCPRFKCNTVSVSFSTCRCNSVVLSSKVGRQKKKESGDSSENVICSCVLPAHCCQPAVAGGVIYADLRGELSTHLALQALFTQCFPVREPLLQAFHFPSTGKGDTAPALSGLRVYLQFMWEVGLPPLLCSFPPTATFTSFPAPGCWARAPAPTRGSLARPACLFTFPGRVPFPQSSALSVPHPHSRVSLLLILLMFQSLINVYPMFTFKPDIVFIGKIT
jgi:hypothetical protein